MTNGSDLANQEIKQNRVEKEGRHSFKGILVSVETLKEFSN